MTIPEALLQFALVAALLTIIPGMDTVLVLRTAISRGHGLAFATAAGICTGTVVWGVVAAVGASALLAASEAAFNVLRIGGACYMAMIPQFLPPEVSPMMMGILLPLVHNVEGMPWFAGIIVATHHARRWLQSPAVAKATDRIAGVVLVAFAARINTAKA